MIEASPSQVAGTVTDYTSGTMLESRHSGYGYWAFMPHNPNDFDDPTIEQVLELGDFTELPSIMRAANATGSVLLEGAPGSGKGHLIEELQMGAAVTDVPTFMLSMHVNGSKTSGIDNIQGAFDQFVEAIPDGNRGLLILDNVDYLGYKGSSRKTGRALGYVTPARDFVVAGVNNQKLVTIGAAHDEDWRRGRWTYGREDIDGPAQETLDVFATKFAFEGTMALKGLVSVLERRFTAQTPQGTPISTLSLGTASSIIRQLDAMDRANFFNANHIDPVLFLREPAAAIADIELGRQQRRKLPPTPS